MTAAALSRKSGVSKQVISHWLNAGEPRRISQVKSVATALGVTVDELCFGSTSAAPSNAEINCETSDLLFEDWISGYFEVRFRRIKGLNK